MSLTYTDAEIGALISERKRLPRGYKRLIQLKDKRGHTEAQLDVEGEAGNPFRLILRQTKSNPFAFSVILALCPRDTNQIFRLCRYNGRNHEHTNQIEGDSIYDFHKHIATQRYQELGSKEDAFAEPSDEFCDLESALKTMFKDCGFELPEGAQPELF